MKLILSFAIALLALGWFAWAASRLTRFVSGFLRGDYVLPLRIAIAAIVWFAVSAITSHFGAQNYFVLGGGASIVAFVRCYPNWQLGLALIGCGLPPAISGFVNALFWPPHSISETLLLDHSIGAIFGGALASGYAFFLCGTISFIWGKVLGLPPSVGLRNGAPFTVESESPDHVLDVTAR